MAEHLPVGGIELGQFFYPFENNYFKATALSLIKHRDHSIDIEREHW